MIDVFINKPWVQIQNDDFGNYSDTDLLNSINTRLLNPDRHCSIPIIFDDIIEFIANLPAPFGWWNKVGDQQFTPIRKFSPRKLHEANQLSTYLRKTFPEMTAILDIGIGKGYVEAVLLKETSIKVIGIERNNDVLDSSLCNQPDKCTFINKNILPGFSAKSDMMIKSSLASHDYTVLFGLHTCADLAKTTADLFKNNPFDGLCLIPCCYHKLYRDADTRQFKSFPASALLHSLLSRHDLNVNEQMLRIGAEQTLLRWCQEDPDVRAKQIRSVIYRAIVEYACKAVKKSCSTRLSEKYQKGTASSEIQDYLEFMLTFQESIRIVFELITMLTKTLRMN
ncbi:hypothetical protein GJ496_005332 [Pomphorhynchus laevis]|nr:hypothetical protein GJ496_005332 [Pomphorhynchus laevis]